MTAASRGQNSAASRPVDPRAASCFDLARGQPEDEEILRPHLLAHLDIGSVERADGERAIQGELHVAGARKPPCRRWKSARKDPPPE